MSLRPWAVGGRPLSADTPLLMGIVNATPDSFFDGGRHDAPEAAIAHALELSAQGARILDVGGESTRPGADPVAPAEEIRRILPVVRELAARGLVVSIDTRHAQVAEAALEAGARIVNDVDGLRDPAMIALCARHGASACAMHMRGTPATMQQGDRFWDRAASGRIAAYADVVAEVGDFLAGALDQWIAAGLPPEALALDPGIGFGKSVEDNYALLAATPVFRARFPRCPWLLGLSRKSFIARTPGVAADSDRLAGSLAAAVAAALSGCDILRVHDVAPTREALEVARRAAGR